MPAPVVLDPAELRAAATSGLMALTGRTDGPPLSPPAGMVARLDQCADAVVHWSRAIGDAIRPDWRDLVTVRAHLLGLHRRGRVSANGTCRLLGGTDGFVAVNLARPDDEAAVAAIVQGVVGCDPWTALEEYLTRHHAAELVERARLVGVPAAALGDGASGSASPWGVQRRWAVEPSPRALTDLRIVDLSSMWAGPLAAWLLARGGGRVTKVESAGRPDGARRVPGFFETLHPDDQCVVRLDLATTDGRRQLLQHVAEADVVIESSRPRALEQLGAGPESLAGPAGKVWLSITGYGRVGPQCDRVAFGDDAAVAAGLVAWEDDHPVFCGDAIADPVTGIIAAAAAMQAVATGGGVLLDVSMEACAASLAPSRRCPSIPAERVDDRWSVVINGEVVAVRDRADDAHAA